MINGTLTKEQLKKLPMPAADFAALEGLIHDYGPSELVRCLAMMCDFQADMLRRPMFSDMELARWYERDAETLRGITLNV